MTRFKKISFIKASILVVLVLTIIYRTLPRKQFDQSLIFVPKNNDEDSYPTLEFPVCDIFTYEKQFHATIDGEEYPKVVPLYHNNSLNFTCLNENRNIGNKRILIWNSTPFKNLLENVIESNKVDKGLSSKEIFEELRCPVTNCDVTVNRSTIEEASLVVFHIRNIVDKFPSYRVPQQRWVHMIYESPLHCGECTKHEGLFNLTATYTKDSDFSSIYWTDSGLHWTQKGLKSAAGDIHATKSSKFAATLVSNCRPDRLGYLKNLQRFMKLDIYGNCGTFECPEKGDCRKHIADSYKFFFVIENSMCTGYVSEKFFNTLKFNVIPVVMGKLDYESWIPRSGYINVVDFKTHEDLANYLKKLSEDKAAYNKYFEWKKYLNYDPKPPKQAYLCEMCIRLNLEERGGAVERKVLTDMKGRYDMHENCWGIRNTRTNFSLLKGKDLKAAFYMSMESNVNRY